MAIDKSLRQYYAYGQLVKKNEDGSRPGYRGLGGYGGGPGGSGGVGGLGEGPAGGGGGGGGRDYWEAPAPAPAPRGPAELGITTRDTTPTSRGKDLHQGPTVKEVLDKVAEDKREQGAIKSLEEAIDRVDKAREEEALKNKIIDEDRERRMGLEGKTGVQDTSLDTGGGFENVDRSKVSQFSEYGRNRMIENLQPKSFFDTGLGKTIKNIGLGVLAPQLLAGTKLGTLYSGYTTANRLSTLADRFGWDKPKEVMSSFTSNLTTPKGTTDTTPKGDRNNREQGIMQAQAPKDVVSKGVEKFSSKQLDQLQQRYAELNNVIESGEYNGQKLNNNQLATLTQTSKQMKDFLVSEVGGMRLT